jgi:DNA-binding response OmpR family regulator
MEETILVIGSNETYIDTVESELVKTNYDVITTDNLSIVKSVLKEEDVMMIIVDEAYLEQENDKLVPHLRMYGHNQPIVVLYEYYNENFILKAFNEGVDDRISVMSGVKVFLARIRNLFKRYYKNYDVIKYKNLTFMSKNNSFYVNGNSLKLTRLEKSLLLEFLKNTNTILSRDSLLENVWEENFNVKIKTVNVAVKRLRDKINLYLGDNYIKSVRGQGYLFS